MFSMKHRYMNEAGEGGDGGQAGEEGGQQGGQAPERPEYVPEKFWDAEKGQIRAEQAFKSYSELEKKLGSPRQEAPEKYEEFKPEGVDEVPEYLSKRVDAIAKQYKLTQDERNELLSNELNAEREMIDQFQKEEQDRVKKEWDKIGNNAGVRIKDVNDWASANMSDELYERAKSMTQTADGFLVMESMIQMMRDNIPSDQATDAGVTKEELEAMRFAKDENGNRKMSVDPKYRQQVRDLEAKLYGNAPDEKVVGFGH